MLIRSILVIAAPPPDIHRIRSTLGAGRRFDRASGIQEGLALLKNSRFDLVFIHIDALLGAMPAGDYAGVLQPFKSLYPGIEIVVIATPGQTRPAVKFVAAGASDYLSGPVEPAELKLVADDLERRIIRQSELDYLRDRFWSEEALNVVQTRSPLMQDVFKKVRSVAPTRTTVLLVGETGTGKGVISKIIHQHSNRQKAQFISVHCGSIPDTLLESELFGHEKGAFTGAVRKKLGKFEIAGGGTIFLDEIGTITPSAQIKLLQVLQEGIFGRVGGEETIQTNARVIAATNADLKTMCSDGRFRKDLFYRLSVFPIEIPPLRHRIEDIPLIAAVFLERLNAEFTKNIRSLHPSVLDAFRSYDWPGNIRELENLMERAYILENANVLTPESFPSELFQTETPTAPFQVDSRKPLGKARQEVVMQFEKQYLTELLARNRGRIKPAAEEAGVTSRQFYKLMTKYGIRKETFKP